VLAALLEIPQGQEGWDRFGFHNRVSHDKISVALKAANGSLILDPVTYPIDPTDWAAWLQRHALQHQRMDAAVGLVSSDFSLLNRDDPAAVARWIATHQLEHLAVEAKLGVSS
jgi:hypothetical protein